MLDSKYFIQQCFICFLSDLEDIVTNEKFIYKNATHIEDLVTIKDEYVIVHIIDDKIVEVMFTVEYEDIKGKEKNTAAVALETVEFLKDGYYYDKEIIIPFKMFSIRHSEYVYSAANELIREILKYTKNCTFY